MKNFNKAERVSSSDNMFFNISNSYHVRKFFEYSNELVKSAQSEQDWYAKIQVAACNWLSIIGSHVS